MSLFNKLGRKAEKLKQQVEAAAGNDYACKDCGEAFATEYDECPECGGPVVAVDTE